MKKSSASSLELIINLTKAASKLSRKIEGPLSVRGIGYTEFIILHHLSNAPANKMRRIDMADLMGMTASGITRLLAPMEKIGLVSREANERDARVSYVVIAPAGQRIYDESLPEAQYLAEGLVGAEKLKQTDVLHSALQELAGGL